MQKNDSSSTAQYYYKYYDVVDDLDDPDEPEPSKGSEQEQNKIELNASGSKYKESDYFNQPMSFYTVQNNDVPEQPVYSSLQLLKPIINDVGNHKAEGEDLIIIELDEEVTKTPKYAGEDIEVRYSWQDTVPSSNIANYYRLALHKLEDQTHRTSDNPGGVPDSSLPCYSKLLLDKLNCINAVVTLVTPIRQGLYEVVLVELVPIPGAPCFSETYSKRVILAIAAPIIQSTGLRVEWKIKQQQEADSYNNSNNVVVITVEATSQEINLQHFTKLILMKTADIPEHNNNKLADFRLNESEVFYMFPLNTLDESPYKKILRISKTAILNKLQTQHITPILTASCPLFEGILVLGPSISL